MLLGLIRVVLISAALTALSGLGVGSQRALSSVPEPDVFDADDPGVSDITGFGELDLTAEGPSDEDLVLAAQKRRTTVQEAPSIIFVVTRAQIQERGYRTINEVLRTVPGFEGDRWEGNGWQKESFARGLPRTILVLLDGVNIVEPLRNFVSLDRKIPLEIVDRIEVTSGPGGVLWGSNALLGIVNIVTRRSEDRGLHAVIGAGDGPGERLAIKGALGLDRRFSEDVALFTHLSFFSTEGPELRLDAQKIVGSLPEPSPDAPTFYLPSPLTVSSGERDWFFNFSGRLELGQLSLDWMVPFEQDHRALATGGAPMTKSFLDPHAQGEASASRDSIRTVQLRYADRYADDDLGLIARAWVTQWQVEDQPFGVYPASPLLLASQGYTKDLRLALVGDQVLRPGAALDLDIRLSDGLTLLTGAELFFDIARDIKQWSWATDTLGECPSGFTYDPTDPHLPCRVEEPLVGDVTRAIGGAFAQADWRVHPRVALSGGLRLQASSQFAPALLWSGGVVWNVAERTHLKLFASSGLRPPGFVATDVRDTTSSITFKANPKLGAETSRSFELEANTVLLRDEGVVRDLYLRANGSLTLMNNLIGRPGGHFENSEDQQVVSAEAFARLRFEAGHELWATYTFTKVFDDNAPGGQIENFSQHIVNLGGRLSFLTDRIELTGLLTLKSAMVDPNRPPLIDPSRPDYSQRCGDILASGRPLDDPIRQACSFPGMADVVVVYPGFTVRETIEAVALLDLGVRFKHLWRDLSVGLFVHNALDFRYYEADLFGDARVLSRPQPKPGMSFFGQLSIGL